jgi:hypothetical protein
MNKLSVTRTSQARSRPMTGRPSNQLSPPTIVETLACPIGRFQSTHFQLLSPGDDMRACRCAALSASLCQRTRKNRPGPLCRHGGLPGHLCLPRYRLSYNFNYGKSGMVSSCSDYSISCRKSIRVVPDFDSSRYSIPPRKWKLLAFAMRLRSFADSLALSPANLCSRSRIATLSDSCPRRVRLGFANARLNLMPSRPAHIHSVQRQPPCRTKLRRVVGKQEVIQKRLVGSLPPVEPLDGNAQSHK